MNAQKISYTALAAVTLAGIYWWAKNPGLFEKTVRLPLAQTRLSVESAQGPVRAMNQYRSVLVAKHLDAWEARRQLELRQRTLSSLAAVQGGTIRRGATSYTRTRDTAEFEIRQEITVMLPPTANWGQTRQDLLHLTKHRP